MARTKGKMSSLEETLASLKQVVTDAACLKQTVKQLRVQLETLVEQERERSHPTALDNAGRKYGYLSEEWVPFFYRWTG